MLKPLRSAHLCPRSASLRARLIRSSTCSDKPRSWVAKAVLNPHSSMVHPIPCRHGIFNGDEASWTRWPLTSPPRIPRLDHLRFTPTCASAGETWHHRVLAVDIRFSLGVVSGDGPSKAAAFFSAGHSLAIADSCSQILQGSPSESGRLVLAFQYEISVRFLSFNSETKRVAYVKCFVHCIIAQY